MSQVGLNRSRVDDSTVQAWYIAVSFRNLNHMFGESNISHVVFVHVCSIRGRTQRHIYSWRDWWRCCIATRVKTFKHQRLGARNSTVPALVKWFSEVNFVWLSSQIWLVFQLFEPNNRCQTWSLYHQLWSQVLPWNPEIPQTFFVWGKTSFRSCILPLKTNILWNFKQMSLLKVDRNIEATFEIFPIFWGGVWN